ncbi:MAG: hypothetical protein GY953_38870, partial [bacterium]|nr:hypothetical protein [bacterium]
DGKREADDLTLITDGATGHTCLEVADQLAAAGAKTAILDLRSLVPLDKDCFLKSVRKTSKALVVHEAHLTSGFGGEVAAIIAEEAWGALDGPVMRVAALDVPAPFSPPLEDAMLPDASKIEKAARALLDGKTVAARSPVASAAAARDGATEVESSPQAPSAGGGHFQSAHRPTLFQRKAPPSSDEQTPGQPIGVTSFVEVDMNHVVRHLEKDAAFFPLVVEATVKAL